jgi:hypothetical protein
MTKHIGSALQVAGMIAVAIGMGLWAGLWGGLLTAGLAALTVGVLLERQLQLEGTTRPAAKQPTVGAVKRALQRRFSRAHRDPRTGGLLTTAPPSEREAGPTGPTAEEIEALRTNWIARR